jgi:indole-3-glycerol phosphate synthase
MNFLNEILEVKKEEVKKLKQFRSLNSFTEEEFFYSTVLEFKSALKNDSYISIIAEIKKASPSKGILIEDFNHMKIAEAYIENEVNAISILTDKNFFQGNINYIKEIAGFKTIPLLRKDFIIDVYQIFEAKAYGADAILLIAEALSSSQINDLTGAAKECKLDVLLELHSEDQIEKINFSVNDLIGINNRNLETFAVDLKTTSKIRTRIPANVILVSESGINTEVDLELLKSSEINAVLVGEHFMKAADLKYSISTFKQYCKK